jgi:8-oxo-dGTP pyrophosphatase MutT (NUDIX family)
MSTDLLGMVSSLCGRRGPVDEREARSIEAFRVAMTTLSDPCSESADTTHVTASAIVVGPEGLLLHRHKRLGIWLQPGGHIDSGEDPADAALRETFEETGVVAQHYARKPLLVHLDVHPGPKGHTHLDLRFLLWGTGAPNPGEGESPDVRWFPWAEAKLLHEPGIATCIAALTSPSFRVACDADVGVLAEISLRTRGSVLQPEVLADGVVTVAVVAGVPIGFVTRAGTSSALTAPCVDPAWANTGVDAQLLVEAQSARLR